MIIITMFVNQNKLYMTDEVLSAQKWTDLVAAIEEKTPTKFPIANKATIRFEISNRMKKDFPDREYKTWTDEETITVYRIK